MAYTNEELNLLDKLASGTLDGLVGNELECGYHSTVTIWKCIKNGIPKQIREGASSKFFNGKENERIPGKRQEQLFDTDDLKLEFLQRFGWLMDDLEVRKYSAKYKGK